MKPLLGLLRFTKIRYWFVKLRYLWMRRNLRIHVGGSEKIGEQTVAHNISALDVNAAFGCGNRMALLVHPVVGYYSFYSVDRSRLRVLMVGCRTEDDIYWMRAYGFEGAVGFDLFSYSPNVMVGDIHSTGFEAATFDVVMLGWMISYTKDPAAVMAECARILKPGGLFGIGIEHDPNQVGGAICPPRVNVLNTSSDLVGLFRDIPHRVVFEYDHYNQQSGDFGAVVLCRCE